MPRHIRIVLPAVHTKSPLPQQIRSVCVACGCRNLVALGARSQHVQCRVCGVVSPDFFRRKPPSGYANEHADPLDKNQASALLDEMLDALTHDNTKRKLQTLQKQAHGDVPLLCHFYVPHVVDVCAMVVAHYGFSSSIEGVKESLRVLQHHATSEDDDQLNTKLIRLRSFFTPTGAWIKEDAEAEADDLKKREGEQERQRRLQEETHRMEELAAENAKKARLRAKKIALGLDPSVPRLPVLDAEPPRVIVVHAEARVELRVVVRYALQLQWFFQGKPLHDTDSDVETHDGTDSMYTGAQRCTLTLRRLTKRYVGDYYCVCTNDEGVVSSQSTRVQLLTSVGSQRLAARKLKMTPSGEITPLALAKTLHSPNGITPSALPPSLLAACVGGALLLLHTRTLAPAKTIPPLELPTGARATAVAWLPSAKLLAVATSTHASPPVPASPSNVCELRLYTVDMPSVAAATVAPPPKHPPKSKHPAPSPQPPPQMFLLRHIATHTIPATLHNVRTLQFLDNGRTLLISDLHHTLLVYELTPTSLVCKHDVRYDDLNHPLCHIATTTSPVSSLGGSPIHSAFVGLAACRRSCSLIDLLETASGRTTTIRFTLPVHRVAFDRGGFVLAVAESGSMKTWISIVSLPTLNSDCSVRRKRFVAHVGKISGMQWTSTSSLLLTCGYDGYVKLWDLEHSYFDPTCVLRLHLDYRGLHSLALVEDSDPIACVAVGFSDCRVHVRELPQLRAFEASRCAVHDRAASQIQKIMKGRRTRDLITRFIRPAV